MSTNQMAVLKGQLESQIKKLLIKRPTHEDIDQIYYMIKLGANPSTTCENRPYYNVLKHVIIFGDLPTFLKFVSEFGYDLELSDVTNNGQKPFDYAMAYLQVDIIQWFLDKKLPQQKIQSTLKTFCEYYFEHKDVEKAIKIVKLLINNGANILEAVNILAFATMVGNLPIVAVPVSIQEKSLEELEKQIKEKDEKINNLITENKKLKQELMDTEAYIDRIAFVKEKWKEDIIRGMNNPEEMLSAVPNLPKY